MKPSVNVSLLFTLVFRALLVFKKNDASDQSWRYSTRVRNPSLCLNSSAIRNSCPIAAL